VLGENFRMQIRNWLDREKMALFGLLFIVLISLIDEAPTVLDVLNREINLNKARDYNCLEEKIPIDEDVLFIGNPLEDPPFSIALALYYRSQYFLAPRLVGMMENRDQISPSNRYSYFISNNLEDENLSRIEEKYQIIPVEECGSFILLKRLEQN
jgi:hypothetical protein